MPDDEVWVSPDGLCEAAEPRPRDDRDRHTLRTERGMAIVALGNLDAERHRGVETLTALLEDTTVTFFAVLGLAKAGAREATADLLAATRHPNPIVRSTIRTTLRRCAASDGFV